MTRGRLIPCGTWGGFAGQFYRMGIETILIVFGIVIVLALVVAAGRHRH